MKRLVMIGIALVLGTGLAMTASAAGNATAGKAKFAVCASCHGPNGAGNKALNAPAIAGQYDWYLVRQLKHFKAGIRGTHPKDTYGAQMRPMAMTLPTDQDVEDVAAYIAAMPKVMAPPTLSGNAAAGQGSYAVCSSCHGVNGAGNKALNAPSLQGQHDWYLVRQLRHFKAGIRGTNPQDAFGMQMRPMSMTLPTDDMVKNVVAYIATLK